MPQPNIVYLHSHDTGRYVQPYGHQIQTPNIQRLADQGLLFRQAFCAAPSCSGSRACLLDLKLSVLERIDRKHAHEEFVFDNENSHCSCVRWAPERDSK